MIAWLILAAVWTVALVALRYGAQLRLFARGWLAFGGSVLTVRELWAAACGHDVELAEMLAARCGYDGLSRQPAAWTVRANSHIWQLRYGKELRGYFAQAKALHRSRYRRGEFPIVKMKRPPRRPLEPWQAILVGMVMAFATIGALAGLVMSRLW